MIASKGMVALGFASRLVLGILIPVGISAGRAVVRDLEARAKEKRRRERARKRARAKGKGR